MDEIIRIAAICGSLRQGSYNLSALRAAKELAPEDVEIEILDISRLPFFSEDLEAAGIPAEVKLFKDKLNAADALLIATPEYNYSLPPALKNALDWASRAPDLPLSDKPAAIMSASTGRFGGARAQYHLRQVCVRLNLLVLNKPELFISDAKEKFVQGKLIDEHTKDAVLKLIEALHIKVKRNK